MDDDPLLGDLHRVNHLFVGAALVLLDGHEPADAGVVPDPVEPNLSPREERLGGDVELNGCIDGKQGCYLLFREEPHEALRGDVLLELPHAEVPEPGHRIDCDACVLPLAQEGLQKRLKGMDGDLVALDLGRLPDPLGDVAHPHGLLLVADLHDGRGLEAADVRVRVEDVDVADVPTEVAHVRSNLVRRLVERDDQSTLPARDPLEQELHDHRRLPGSEGARDDVRPVRDQPSVQHPIEAGHPRRDLHAFFAPARRAASWSRISSVRRVFAVTRWRTASSNRLRFKATTPRRRAASASPVCPPTLRTASTEASTSSTRAFTSSAAWDSRNGRSMERVSSPRAVTVALGNTVIPCGPIVMGRRRSSNSVPRIRSMEIALLMVLPSIHL